MNFHSMTRSRLLIAGCAFGLSLASGHAAAAQFSLPVNPLFVSNDAAPNLMFMVDNSGSMSNVVPDVPYDPDVTYLAAADCPAANQYVPSLDQNANASLDLQVRDSGSPNGLPYVLYSGDRRLWGTDSEEVCFLPNKLYGARLNADTDGGSFLRPGNYLDAVYTGNYLNWYFDPNSVGSVTWNNRQPTKPIGGGQLVQPRMNVAREAGVSLMQGLDARLRVGLSTYQASANGGRLLQAVGPLTDAKRSALISSVNGLSPTGSTPLAETLLDIGRYFANGYTGNIVLHPDDAVRRTSASVSNVFNSTFENNSTTAPVTLSCQQSFAVLLTDGRPQQDQAMSSALQDYDGDCPSCSFDRKPSPYEYESAGSDYLDDVAQALFEIDLRPDFPVETGSGEQFKNNVVSYVIGFADQQVLNDPLVADAGEQGGGGFFVAENAASLTSTFNSIITDVLDRAAAFSSAALNSTSLNAGTRLFQAGFNSANWSGTLTATPISTGAGGACPSQPLGRLCPQAWEASSALASKAPGDRVILTLNRDTDSGIPFRWANLPATQQALLNRNPNTLPTQTADTRGSQRLSYVRGNDSEEGSGTTNFRPRLTKLGDIVNSDPFFVGAPNNAFPFGGYSAFRAANLNRPAMVYVGANDGMLHGFDVASGEEKLAYVPSKMFGTNADPKLARLTAQPYTHVWGVDGSPTAGDVQIGPGKTWRTYLVGTLRYGGQGLFALDVTDPTSFSEGNAGSIVKWEFTDEDDGDLGYTFSQPSIVKFKGPTDADERWAAVIGNGYNNREGDGSASADGRAALFIIFLDGPGADGTWDLGTDYLKFKVGSSPSASQKDNGLASPATVDIDGDSLVDYIFAGDLLGNMWQFNVNDTDTANWGVAYGGTALATATSVPGGAQPITAPPEVGFNLLTSDPDDLIVYFGTGQYFAAGDNTQANQLNQTFYGIFADPVMDTDPLVERASWTTVGKGSLLRQRVLQEVATADGLGVRVTTQEPISVGASLDDAATTDRGWFIDLYNTATAGDDPTPASGLNRGERQISRPILRSGRIVFTTLIPSENPCDFGGSGWLMEIDARTGGRPEAPALDITDDLIVDVTDVITVTIDGDSVEVPVSGIGSPQGMLSTPAVLALTPSQEAKYSVRSDGSTAVFGEAASGRIGRVTWREISP